MLGGRPLVLICLTLLALISGGSGTITGYYYVEKKRKDAQKACQTIRRREAMSSIRDIGAARISANRDRLERINRTIGDKMGRTRNYTRFEDCLENVKGIGLNREAEQAARAEVLKNMIAKHNEGVQARASFESVTRGINIIGLARQEAKRARAAMLQEIGKEHVTNSKIRATFEAPLKDIARNGKARVDGKDRLSKLISQSHVRAVHARGVYAGVLKGVLGVGHDRERCRVEREEVVGAWISGHLEGVDSRSRFDKVKIEMNAIRKGREEKRRAREEVLEGLAIIHLQKSKSRTNFMAPLQDISATGKAKVESKESLATLIANSRSQYMLAINNDVRECITSIHNRNRDLKNFMANKNARDPFRGVERYYIRYFRLD